MLLAGAAVAQDQDETSSNPMSFHGVTLYGTLDIAIAYQSHGVPLSADFPPGLEYVVSKNSGRAQFGFAPNALSSSAIGLRGDEPIIGDLSGAFDVETQFLPTSLHIVDGLKSIVKNNGRPLGAQSANYDSSKGGQFFGGQAWAGLESKRFGALTFGRQSSFFLDDLLAYDPISASAAFSVVGYLGAAAAGASTEDARVDRSLKYVLTLKPFRFGALYQFGVGDRLPSRLYQFSAGYDFGQGGFDVSYGHVNDSIQSSTLSASQLLIAPRNSVAATIADTNSLGLYARYAISPLAQIYLGFEEIGFENPKRPLVAGDRTIGGYLLGVVNNTAFSHHRQFVFSWLGTRYSIDPRLYLTLTYYRLTQNSYGADTCTNDVLPTCSGTIEAISAVAVYNIDKWLDVYAGAMYSKASNGLASGFLHGTSIDPMTGIRFKF
jgi:predicted porin